MTRVMFLSYIPQPHIRHEGMQSDRMHASQKKTVLGYLRLNQIGS